MISPEQIKPYIEDYRNIYNTTTEKFVCPITLQECNDEDLIRGHILNQSLSDASKRTVVQYGPVDHFYGATVEPELVKFLNMSVASQAEYMKSCTDFKVILRDGMKLPAFYTEGKSAKSAKNKYPIVPVDLGVEGFVPLYVKTDKDDPRLAEAVRVSGVQVTIPSHFVASIMKVSLLTMFDMMGYRTIKDPLTEILRSTLARYFNNRASREDAHKYFSEFQKSINFLGLGTALPKSRSDYRSLDFDTLQDRVIFAHFWGGERRNMFAVTLLYKINGITIASTIPQSIDNTDEVSSWKQYQRLLDDDPTLVQQIHRVDFHGHSFRIHPKPLNVLYHPDMPE